MLELTAVALFFLWIVGVVSSHTLGGFIHIFLVPAVVVIMIRVFFLLIPKFHQDRN